MLVVLILMVYVGCQIADLIRYNAEQGVLMVFNPFGVGGADFGGLWLIDECERLSGRDRLREQIKVLFRRLLFEMRENGNI